MLRLRLDAGVRCPPVRVTTRILIPDTILFLAVAAHVKYGARLTAVPATPSVAGEFGSPCNCADQDIRTLLESPNPHVKHRRLSRKCLAGTPHSPVTRHAPSLFLPANRTRTQAPKSLSARFPPPPPFPMPSSPNSISFGKVVPYVPHPFDHSTP